MRYRWQILLAMIACGSGGCVAPDKEPPLWARRLASATRPLQHSWARITEVDEPASVPDWNWATAVPLGAPRAELYSAHVPQLAMAHFLPSMPGNAIALVSTHPAAQSFQITNIGGEIVNDYGDLNRALEQALESGGPTQVDLALANAPPNAPESAVEVDRATLLSICHSIADHQPVIRAVEEGNPWLVVRSGGIRSKLLARVEPNQGLLQIVLTIANCWEPQRLLPVEVSATCQGEPLRCLSVAESLDRLYGEADGTSRVASGNDARACRFSVVSEQEGFLIPSNYKRLLERTQSRHQQAGPRRQPAFAAVPGATYPGPPILGDARALAGFLMQRKPLRPGVQHTGWIIFAGEPLRHDGEIEVTIDMGRGPQVLRFRIPTGA